MGFAAHQLSYILRTLLILYFEGGMGVDSQNDEGSCDTVS